MARAAGPALLIGRPIREPPGRPHRYIDGQRVEDVTAHPAFRTPRSIARLRRLHDPSQHDVSSSIATGSRRTGSSCRATAEELLAAREAIAAWARMSYGFMGRTPDYKASFMATLGAAPEFYAPFEASAEGGTGATPGRRSSSTTC